MAKRLNNLCKRRTLYRQAVSVLTLLLLLGCDSQSDPAPGNANLTVPPSVNAANLDPVLTPAVSELTTYYLEQVQTDFQTASQRIGVLATRIVELLATPSQTTLSAARSAWLQAHVSYEATALHRRFVESIATDDIELRLIELEYQINQWPILPGYLDAVSGFGESGLVFDTTVQINAAALRQLHGQFELNEAATGFHVLEFLLWGENQPLSGLRPVSDFRDNTQLTQTQEIAGYSLEMLPNNRRRQLLTTVAELLVDDFEETYDTVTLAVTAFRQDLPYYSGAQLVHLLASSMWALLSDEILIRSLYPLLNGNYTQAMQSPFSGSTQNAIVAQLVSVEQLLLVLQTASGVSLDTALIQLTPDFGEFFYQNFDASKECLVLLYSQITPPATSQERIANEFEIVECINLLNNMIDHLQQARQALTN